LVISVPVRAGQSPAPDAFLDQPIPSTSLSLNPNNSTWLQFKTYAEQVAKVRATLPKQVTLPDGVVDFVTSVDNGYFSTVGYGLIFVGIQKDLPTQRKFLDAACPRLEMAWSYDPSRDAIVLDFPWRRDDPRTSGQLLDALEHTGVLNSGDKPISRTATSATYAEKPNERYFWDHHKLAPDDKWRIAFDALLSKPENFASAWKVRLAEDLRRDFGFPMLIDNLFAAKMKDENGAAHVLIVNSQPELMNPGPVGSIGYYVFDLNGKFEQGGLCSIGYRCMDASVWLDSEGKQLTLRVFNNGSYQIDEKFALTKKGLIIGDVIDNKGIPMTGYRLMGTCYGLPLLHVPN